MKIERQQVMVKSVAKSMRQKERKEVTYYKLRSKVVEICNKYNTDIEGLIKSKMSKSEIKAVQDFYINQVGESVAIVVFKKWFD